MKKQMEKTMRTLVIALLVLSGCARSGSYKSDRDYYEETGDGYYQTDPTPKVGDGQKIERLKQPKKRVLVLSFWNDTPVADSTIGDFGAEELKRELYIRNRVVFPDEKSVISATKDFVDGDRIQLTQLIREGRRAGVSTVIVGRISKLNFRHDSEEVGILREAQSAVTVDVEIKTFDVAAGREVHSAKRTGSAASTTKILFDQESLSNKDAKSDLAKEAVKDAVARLVPQAVLALEKMDWQGRVAKILGNKVYINAGRASGLLSGDVLKVLSPGEEIVDPVTHAYLGRSEGLLKGTLEVSEFIGEDTAMTLIHTGGNFQDGDVVRLY